MCLTYTGSKCRDGAAGDVDEGSGRVITTVRETVTAMSCSDVGVSYKIQVRLDAPLADRRLVDGACQLSEYAQCSDCGPDEPTVETTSN